MLEEYRQIDPYQAAKEIDRYEEFTVSNDMTIEKIAERVVANREKYRAKFEKKKAQQDNYY